MIKRLGHNVRILEQYPSAARDGQAGGVSSGAQTRQSLGKYDLVTKSCVASASGLQIVDSGFNILEFRSLSFEMTTWEILQLSIVSQLR